MFFNKSNLSTSWTIWETLIHTRGCQQPHGFVYCLIRVLTFFSFVWFIFLAIATLQNFYSSEEIKPNNVESVQLALCWAVWVSSLRFTLASLPPHSSYFSVILKHNYSIDKYWTRQKSAVVKFASLQTNILFDYRKMSILSLNLDSFFFNYQN